MPRLRARRRQVLLLLLALWTFVPLAVRPRRPGVARMIAHRGAAGLAPENTLASIQAAVAAGADRLEVDVQRTADGTLVLFHDATLERTTDGAGRLAEASWETVRRLDAGGWFGEAYRGEPVPTLDEALARLEGWPGTLVLEAKDPARYPGVESQILEALRARNREGRVVVVSFDHAWLDRFHALAPQVPVGRLALWAGPGMCREGVASVGVHWLSVLLDPTSIWRAHRAGCEVWVWTVNSPWLMRLLNWLGVDAITTDRPDLWPWPHQP